MDANRKNEKSKMPFKVYEIPKQLLLWREKTHDILSNKDGQ